MDLLHREQAASFCVSGRERSSKGTDLTGKDGRRDPDEALGSEFALGLRGHPFKAALLHARVSLVGVADHSENGPDDDWHWRTLKSFQRGTRPTPCLWHHSQCGFEHCKAIHWSVVPGADYGPLLHPRPLYASPIMIALECPY